MAISSVDLDRALTSASYAQQVLRSGNVSVEQKGQLVEKWGADNVNKWLSVDSTSYEIDDLDYKYAKEAGADSAKDSTGYDGGKTYGAVGDAVLSAGAAVGARLGAKAVGNAVEAAVGWIPGVKVETKSLSDIATAILSSAVAAKYWLQKPNEDQVKAARQLMSNDLPEGFSTLEEAQEDLEEASAKVTELTEEADAKNEDANKKIQEQKAQFDYKKQQYQALKAKKEGGEELTPDEEDLLKRLAPEMEGMVSTISETGETVTSEVGALNDEIGEYEASYDESAEKIATVEGVTDFAEGFDENSRTMMYVEGAAQGVNMVSAGIAAVKLWAKATLSFGATTVFAAMASAAALASRKAMTQQLGWAKEMTSEIDLRREVQDEVSNKTDLYDEELDNYAGNVEIVENLEVEVPQDLEVPQNVAADTMPPAPKDEKPQNAPPANQPEDGDGEDDPKKKPEDQ